MNPQAWFTVIGIACTVIVTVTTWGFITGKWTTSEANKIARLEDTLNNCIRDHARRFEEAGRETSKAMTYVQGMESRFTREFASRELTDERFSENRREHDRFSQDLARLMPKRGTDN